MSELATLQHDEQDHMVSMIKPRFLTGQATMMFMDDPLTNLPAFVKVV